MRELSSEMQALIKATCKGKTHIKLTGTYTQVTLNLLELYT